MKKWTTSLRRLIFLAATAAKGILKTITGNPIHITDALAKPVQALSIALEPIQDLHGYDNPWPSGGGVNQFAIGDAAGLAVPSACYGLTITLDATNETVRIHGTPTWSAAGAYTFRIIATKNGYWGAASVDHDYTGMNYFATIVSKSSNVTGIGGISAQEKSTLSIDSLAVTNTSEIDLTIRICISTSPVTAWTPYSNICPISGHTDADVTRTGKNLLDKANGAKNLYVGGGNVVGNSGTLLCFLAKRGMQYTINMTGGNRTNFYYYDAKSLDEIVAGITLTPITLSAAKPYTFTASQDGVYCYYANTDFLQSIADSCMVELGSTASAYEPYVGTTYPIPLGTTVYGGTLDVVTGVLTVTYGMVDLGTRTWTYIAPTTAIPYGTFYNTILDKKYGQLNLICDSYPTKAGFINDFSIQGNSAASTIYLQNSTFNGDISALTASLSGVMLCYELTTPQTIQLTPTQVELLLGENNIWSDGEMTLVYLADGNASDAEALNILLGGRYVNNHGEDEPSDREALDILLGRTR